MRYFIEKEAVVFWIWYKLGCPPSRKFQDFIALFQFLSDQVTEIQFFFLLEMKHSKMGMQKQPHLVMFFVFKLKLHISVLKNENVLIWLVELTRKISFHFHPELCFSRVVNYLLGIQIASWEWEHSYSTLWGGFFPRWSFPWSINPFGWMTALYYVRTWSEACFICEN